MCPGPPLAHIGKHLAGEEISWEELKKHASPTDLWIAIDGIAYDVTEWKRQHPGGFRLLEFYGGMDATEPFIAYHAGPSRAVAVARMQSYRIGPMEPKELSVQAVAYRKMAADVEKAGLYKRNPWNYYLLFAYLAALFCATWWLVGQRSIILASFTIGAFWGQLAFIGHDVGHRCVFESRWRDGFLGCWVTAFLGIGVSHWVDNHNAHHAVVNSSDCDPEVQFMPFIAPSTLHFEHTRKNQTPLERISGLISKNLISYQHLSFIPLLLFARYKFYFQSMGHWSSGSKIYVNRWTELAAQLFFFTWFVLLTAQLPTWIERVAWIVLSHASDFVLYLQTVITHFPREISPGVKTDWIESQATGTLNWDCTPDLDWFHGGLQWQIEHHLFPRIPRHNLRRASLITRPCLKELGINYHSPTFLGAIIETFESLKVVAMEARKPLEAAAAPFFSLLPSPPLSADGTGLVPTSTVTPAATTITGSAVSRRFAAKILAAAVPVTPIL